MTAGGEGVYDTETKRVHESFQAETNMTLNFNLKRKESSFKAETTMTGGKCDQLKVGPDKSVKVKKQNF